MKDYDSLMTFYITGKLRISNLWSGGVPLHARGRNFQLFGNASDLKNFSTIVFLIPDFITKVSKTMSFDHWKVEICLRERFFAPFFDFSSQTHFIRMACSLIHAYLFRSTSEECFKLWMEEIAWL